MTEKQFNWKQSITNDLDEDIMVWKKSKSENFINKRPRSPSGNLLLSGSVASYFVGISSSFSEGSI